MPFGTGWWGSEKKAPLQPGRCVLKNFLGDHFTPAIPRVTQGLAVATGLKDKFDWRAVATSVVAAPVVHGLTQGLPDGPAADFGSRLTRSLVSGIVTQRVRMAVYNEGKLDYASIAADAFGNALGQGIVDAMKSPGYTREEMIGDYQRERNRFVAAARANAAAGSTLVADDGVPTMTAGGGIDPLGQQSVPSPSGTSSSGTASPVASSADGGSQYPTQRIVITGRRMSDAEKWAYDAEHWLDDQLASINQYWDEQKDAAVRNGSAAGYIGAHMMGLLGQTGNSLGRGGVGAVRLATDPRAQINTVVALGGAIAHPLDTATRMYQGARGFMAKPFGEQADSAFKFATGTLATAGLGKVGTFGERSAIRLGDDAVLGLERSLGSTAGHPYAFNVLEGGTGTAFAGHGYLRPGAGMVLVPEGTAITLPRDGIRIGERTGQLMERGDWEGLGRLAAVDQRVARDIEGMTTWLPGAEIPNYILTSPSNPGLTIYRNSATVDSKTPLIDLLRPNMGCVQWAACTEYRPR